MNFFPGGRSFRFRLTLLYLGLFSLLFVLFRRSKPTRLQPQPRSRAREEPATPEKAPEPNLRLRWSHKKPNRNRCPRCNRRPNCRTI